MTTAVPLVPSWRFTLGFLELLGTLVLYMNRVNISFALVCMTKPPGGVSPAVGTTNLTNLTQGGGAYGGNSNVTLSLVSNSSFLIPT